MYFKPYHICAKKKIFNSVKFFLKSRYQKTLPDLLIVKTWVVSLVQSITNANRIQRKKAWEYPGRSGIEYF